MILKVKLSEHSRQSTIFFIRSRKILTRKSQPAEIAKLVEAGCDIIYLDYLL